MALQSSGAISMSNINVELGLSSTAQISLNDSAVRALLQRATGQISLSDAYGKSATTYGINWTGYSISSIMTDCNQIIWDGSKFIMIGFQGKAATSSDGVNWTALTGFTSTYGTTTSHDPRDLVYNGSSLYVCVGTNGTSGRTISSTDGVTWTGRTAPTNNLNTIAFANSLYVLGQGGGGRILTSSTGIGSWTERTSTFSTTAVNQLRYLGGKWIAVGNTGKCATSSDAITWTQQTSLATAVSSTSMNAIAHNGSNTYVAVGYSGKCATSSDGVTWTNRSSMTTVMGSSRVISDVCWAGSEFMATGWQSSTSSRLAASTDGITWATRSGFLNKLPTTYEYAVDIATNSAYTIIVVGGNSGGIVVST